MTESDLSIETLMLDALQLFHYSYCFRDSLFIVALEKEIPLSAILTDLRVLQASHISVLVVMRKTSELAQTLGTWSERGMSLYYLDFSEQRELGSIEQENINSAFEKNSIPVLAVNPKSSNEKFNETTSIVAETFAAKKVFFLSGSPGLTIDGTLKSHLSSCELEDLISNSTTFDIAAERLSLLSHKEKEQRFEIVLLEGSSGSLFEEIFTHRGKGTLLTEDYPNVIRKAELRDVFDISLLLKPYIVNKLVLPTKENDIAEQIESYYVYTVNNAVIASSQLLDYGEASALSKFCTLPRFQGKGRAKELAATMIEEARKMGKNYVFALSVEPRMWDFFRGLGFTETARGELPGDWKENYDFSRPSKAFTLGLNNA